MAKKLGSVKASVGSWEISGQAYLYEEHESGMEFFVTVEHIQSRERVCVFTFFHLLFWY